MIKYHYQHQFGKLIKIKLLICYKIKMIKFNRHFKYLVLQYQIGSKYALFGILQDITVQMEDTL